MKSLAPVALAALLFPVVAFAQNPPQGATTTTGVVGGAVTGAVVGGPVGAVVGAVIGGAVGAAAEPPPEVQTYVLQEPMQPTRVQAEIIEGRPLATDVEIHPVPKYPQYGFAIVNNRRVIVDPKTRQVIKVVE